MHADIPHQDVIFLEEVDPISSPMKAKGIGELVLCGVGAALANAIYKATGVHVRDYPITLIVAAAISTVLATQAFAVSVTQKSAAEAAHTLPGEALIFADSVGCGGRHWPKATGG